MENKNNPSIDFSNSKYTDEYMEKLIRLSFSYYDHQNDTDKYENSVMSLIKEYQSSIPEIDTKSNLKYLIDFIGKYPTANLQFIDSSLKDIKMNSTQSELFKKMLYSYSEEVNKMKDAIIEKVVDHRIIDFTHSFSGIYFNLKQ